MSQADIQYNNIIKEIIENGVMDDDYEVRPKWESDGQPAYTKSIISQKMRFDNSEVPILTTKRVAWKTAIKELLWIWQKKSNVVQELRDMGVNIWNQWELEDGTIGRAYGYQLGKRSMTARKYSVDKLKVDLLDPKYGYENLHYSVKYTSLDQVDYLIQELINNPTSRRHITTLWNPDELDKMALNPCVYETQWYVKDKKLHLEVRCRSNDMALGNPFNILQYNILQRMIAQVTGYGLGEFIYNIGDCHAYNRHLPVLEKQIEAPQYEAPKLWINPEVKSFYDFTIDDFQLIDYKHGETLKMEVAV